MSVSSPLARLKIVVVGAAAHGKSALIGRLVFETGALPAGVVDADGSHRCHSARRGYALIEPPSSSDMLRQAVVEAESGYAGVLVIDALAGIQEETRRYACLLRLMGLQQIVVAINKMDLAAYDATRFFALREEILCYLADIEIQPDAVSLLPVSAREGENVCTRSSRLAWFAGPTLLQALDAMPQPPRLSDRPLRLPIHDVHRIGERCTLIGRVESGSFHVGEMLMFSPRNKTARVASLEAGDIAQRTTTAVAGQPVRVTLDAPIFVEQGEIASHVHAAPKLTNMVSAKLAWLGRNALTSGTRVCLRIGAAEVVAVVDRVERVLHVSDPAAVRPETVDPNGIAQVVLRTRGIVAVDDSSAGSLGRFLLVDGDEIVGGGSIDMLALPDLRGAFAPKSGDLTSVTHRVSLEERAAMNGHRGGILWMTGLSSAGKTTLAAELERRLFAKGHHVFLLDGDNVRQGLSVDLGFSPADRTENIRRIGEVAALFAEAGTIVITAFISPYRIDRDRVRALHPEIFNEIYVHAPLEVCEARDAKGLYKRARAGEIKEFTGISAPYEPPIGPELTVDTSVNDVDACLALLLAYVEERFQAHAGAASGAPRRSGQGRSQRDVRPTHEHDRSLSRASGAGHHGNEGIAAQPMATSRRD